MLTERRERGQVLILFIALFSVVLTLAAIGIDQGLWLGQRGVAQKDADAAARAGASAYLGAIDTPSSAAATAEARAVEYAVRNGAPTPIPTITSSSDCPTIVGTGAGSPTPIPNAPSVSIGVGRPAPGLFTRALWSLLGMAGSPDQTNIGASSTACVGSVLTIGPAGREMLPVEVNRGTTTCFDNTGNRVVGARVGMQCVIASGSKGGVVGLLHATSASECVGAGTADGTLSAIKTGMDSTCTVNTGSACDTRVRYQNCVYPADAITPSQMVASWHDRLKPRGSYPLTCASDSFADTFDYADGTSGPVTGPPALGGTDSPGTVYVQKRCSNPRVGIVIVTDRNLTASDASGAERNPVRGFAAVYILGCFDPTAPLTTNTCSSGEGAGHHEGDEGNGGAKVEVRAVLLRLFMTNGAVGGIGPINDGSISGALSPVTIQTTR